MSEPEIISLPYQPDTEPVFDTLRHLPGAVWLDSGKPRSLQGRFDILSALPLWQLETRGRETRLQSPAGENTVSGDDPFSLAGEVLAQMGMVSGDYSHLPFVGGLIGFFGYELGRVVNRLAPRREHIAQPDMHLGWYGWALVCNHQSRQCHLIFHPACPGELRDRVRSLIVRPSDPSPADPFHITRAFAPSISRRQYLGAIATIKDYILAGDCYQTNFAQHFAARFEGDPWLAYRALRYNLPSPYSAYLAWPGGALLSLSPERFLKLSVGQVETKPIKGTTPRGHTVAEDNDNAVDLLNSAKDRAENLMIVDLLRNDLGKSCEPGSIRVPKLFALESFANVHHLVSTITGRLRDDSSALELLREAFPGGSITGAPKKRAMEIIDELEARPRGTYCGSVGYISANGRMDTNIAIRTLVAEGDQLHCWGGGGIVADSDPEQEYQETLDKVRGLMSTLEAL